MPCINPIAQLGAINDFQSAASSYYNGAALSISRRVARGSYSAAPSYTYTLDIDDGQNAFVAVQPHRAEFLRAHRRRRSQQDGVDLNGRLPDRSQSFLGHFYRRMRAKLGAPKAITATAHKLARILYHMVTTGHAYDETICAQNEVQNRKRMEARLRKQAREFGLQLVAL